MSGSVMGHSTPDSVREMSPDAVSPIYPDRPIRPLPKRRLRERLSPDVAESIKYPPAPTSTTPLFYYPYNINGEEDARGGLYPVDRHRTEEVERNYISRRNGEEIDSDDDYHESLYRGRYARHSPETATRSYRYVQKPASLEYPKPEPPPSTTSSVDGYDSFENSNNKKKRKIPTPGDASVNGIHLSNDLAALGISTTMNDSLVREDAINTGPKHYTTGGSVFTNQGFSGPGRGRYGRVRNGRSPLRNLLDVNWASGRAAKQPQWSASKHTGIISTAMANAEKASSTSSRGQENVSLLQQQASKKSSPASAQFTFTCDSQVPGTVPWPGPESAAPNVQATITKGVSTHGTQTSPHAAVTPGQPRQGTSVPPHLPGASKQGGKQTAPAKKLRRRTAAKEYLMAARRRREQQEYQNYHHPPAPADEWICEFCEYERIFGTPPEALIRQYEIKDRRIRKQEAERRRLLEKAKLKGRKGKKGSKPAARNVVATYDRQNRQQAQQAASVTHSQSQGTQSDGFYEDDYDDDYPRDDPPPSPVGLPAHHVQGDNSHFQKRKAVQAAAGHSEKIVS